MCWRMCERQHVDTQHMRMDIHTNALLYVWWYTLGGFNESNLKLNLCISILVLPFLCTSTLNVMFDCIEERAGKECASQNPLLLSIKFHFRFLYQISFTHGSCSGYLDPQNQQQQHMLIHKQALYCDAV